MNKKLLAIAIGGAALLAGCSGGDSATGDTGGTANKGGGEKKSFTITMIAKSSNNPVFPAAQVGAEAAAKELSAAKNMDIKIDWRTPPNEDGQVQATNIAQAVTSGSDAILIACSDAGKVTGAINDAVAKGVPVMTFDSDAPDSNRFAFYGADDIAVGMQVAEELAKQTGGKGSYAILAGNQNAPNLQKRVQGVKDGMKKYPDMKFVNTFYHPETAQEAAAEVKRAMNANPQIDCWAMVGGWPLFTKTLLTDLDPAKVKIVAVDCLPAQLPYIETGIAPVLLAQPVYDWGKVSTEIIVKHLIDKQEVPKMNKMELVTVTKDNLKEWAAKLKEWGFKDIDAKYLQ